MIARPENAPTVMGICPLELDDQLLLLLKGSRSA